MTLPELLWITFLAAALTDLATGLGPLPLLFVRSTSEQAERVLTAAAAGMMTSASLVMLVGEGVRLAPDAWRGVGIGFLVGVVFFQVATGFIKRHETLDFAGLRAKGGTTALLFVLAMTLHSFPEGVAVGVSFGSASQSGSLVFGSLMTLAIAAHNVPEGLAIGVALRARGFSISACVGWSIFTSIPQPLAAVPAAAAVWLFEPLLPVGMGFAAGAMMTLVVNDMLPESFGGPGDRRGPGLGFVLGLIVMTLLGLALASDHGPH